VKRSLMSWFSCIDVRFLYLFMLNLIISCMSGIFKSSCRVGLLVANIFWSILVSDTHLCQVSLPYTGDKMIIVQ
jgi:hypothetical protein